jgi:hypothetical protein
MGPVGRIGWRHLGKRQDLTLAARMTLAARTWQSMLDFVAVQDLTPTLLCEPQAHVSMTGRVAVQDLTPGPRFVVRTEAANG